MSDLGELSGEALRTAVRQGRASVGEIAHSCVERIAQRDPLLHAFVHHDPALVLSDAAALDRSSATAVLRGTTVGVKDLVDTADQPTAYGSAVHAGHRPAADAAVVARLRHAGALVAGKTVTTEFALFTPGPTVNPHDPDRTPGGSSSGSAAAVADRMVTVAVGTQTAGSVIRPASFCGVVGFKPTFGALDRTGAKLISPSLDTVGLLGRDVAEVATVFAAVRSGRRPAAPAPVRRRLGFVRTADWDRADATTRRGLEVLADQLASRGWDVVERPLPDRFGGLVAAQTAVMEVEARRCLAPELATRPELLSDALRAFLARGEGRTAPEYDDALELAALCRSAAEQVFAEVDAVLTPAVVGEAPVRSAGTGDPLFCRAWTLLHWPALSLPLLSGPSSLPVGVQLVGAPSADDALLEVAAAVVQTADAP